MILAVYNLRAKVTEKAQSFFPLICRKYLKIFGSRWQCQSTLSTFPIEKVELRVDFKFHWHILNWESRLVGPGGSG